MRTTRDLLTARLRRQHLHHAGRLKTPAEVVAWLGAVQSQDHGGAKWALGLRLAGVDEAAIDRAFENGEFVRTHVLRPTWHFVAPADLRWLQALTADRVRAGGASQHRQFGFTEALVSKAIDTICLAIRTHGERTREELRDALSGAGFDLSDGVRLAHVVMLAELEGVICSGRLRGKAHTYALTDVRLPKTRAKSRDTALAELARRYFTSHGPATAKDFAWWSGLSVTDAKRAIEAQRPALVSTDLDGRTCWHAPLEDDGPEDPPRALLLPNYDEYVVAYEDRSAFIGEVPPERIDARGHVLFHNTLVLDGRIAGVWTRTLAARRVVVQVSPFGALSNPARRAVTEAAHRFATFVGRELELEFA